MDGGGGGVFGAIAGRIWVNQSCVEFQKPDVKGVIACCRNLHMNRAR